MDFAMVNWIMGCIQSVSFVVLINKAPSRFFRASQGLREGCPLSPLLLLIVADALSKLITVARRSRAISGVNVSTSESITHLLFDDDVLCFVQGTVTDLSTLKGILDLHCSATSMQINVDK